jgi:hypothetical protein
MGTQIIGRVANPEDAHTLADALLTYNPYFVKAWEPIWMNVSEGFRIPATPTVIDHRPIYFTHEEQLRMVADRIKALDRFYFMVTRPQEEGKKAAGVDVVTSENLDADQYPDPDYIASVRALLRQAYGVPVAELLKEIEQRKPALSGEPKKKTNKTVPPREHGKIPGQPAHETSNNHLPDGSTQPKKSQEKADDVWQ